MAYEWPPDSGKWLAWQFDSPDQIEQVFGPNWMNRITFENRRQGWLDDRAEIMDSVDEVVGLEGTWQKLMQDTMAAAAAAGGVTDPTLVGMIANDAEWQDIMARAALGQYSPEQVTALLRQTALWTQVLYPGIESLYSMTTEPELAWATYAQTVEDGLRQLGVGTDADGTFRLTIGDMLNRGIDDDMFVDAVPTFVRASQSQQYFDALNQWTERRLGTTLTFDDWFAVLEGEARQDIQLTFEAAQAQYAMEISGIADEFGNRAIMNLARETDLSLPEMLKRFDEVEQNLLAIGDDLGRFQLNRNDLLAASAGIQADSGRSSEWIRRQAAKAAIELGLMDDVNTQLFVGYDPERGTPERPGLNVLAPEVG